MTLKDVTVPESVGQWIKHLELNRRYSVHTLAAYLRDLQQLVVMADGKPLEQLVNGDIFWHACMRKDTNHAAWPAC